jgi:hypothetical protein
MNREHNKRSRSLTVIITLLICLLTAGRSLAADQPPSSGDFFPGDFLEYWASARLLLDGKNPYSPEEQFALQRSVVADTKQPLMMWNPPWTLSFVLPFGLLGFPLALALWSILILLCLLFCSAHLWRIYGGPPDRYRVAWLTCFSVVPTYLTLYVKQIDPLVLLGIVGFLYFHERKRDWLVGLSLTLVAIKPHLVYLFWIALIVWLLDQHQWKVILGAAAGGVIASLIPLMFAPDIFGQYLDLYSTNAAPKPFDWKTPTLSTALGLLFGQSNVWIRYVPAAFALTWFVFHWRKNRSEWNWTQETPLLLLVSQATTVFAWVWDQILLLPVLIYAAVWATRGGPTRSVVVAIVGFLIIDLAPILVMSGVLIPDGFSLFWMVPLFLLVYWISRLQTTEQFTTLHIKQTN